MKPQNEMEAQHRNHWQPEEVERVAKRLKVLFATFEIIATPEKFQGYLEALEGLSPEQVEVGCLEAVKRSRRCPSPADVRDWALERGPQKQLQEAKEECELCGGTGFKVVNRPNSEGKWAISCDCRKTA